EVVVMGYGNKRKQSVTSSVTTVTSESISKGRRKKKDITNALAGQVSGVKISTASGQPGNNANIIIRGTNSLSGNNEPLYIVDGVPVTSIDALDKKDIKSTSVLKDAATT